MITYFGIFYKFIFFLLYFSIIIITNITKEDKMILIGNILWFLLGGWFLFIGYTFAAIIFFPIFLPIFRIAKYSLFPFGKAVVYQKQLDKFRELNKSSASEESDASGGIPIKNVAKGLSGILNILWVLTFGWILALTHLSLAITNLALFFLIVTIPNIGGHWKMMKIAFMPFNTVIVPKKLAEEIEVEITKGNLNI